MSKDEEVGPVSPKVRRVLDLANSMVLVESIDAELKLGTKHYNKKGKLLKTIDEIVECLKTDGVEGMIIEPTKEREHLFEPPPKVQGRGKVRPRPYVVRSIDPKQ
jgi:hypothetical protein